MFTDSLFPSSLSFPQTYMFPLKTTGKRHIVKAIERLPLATGYTTCTSTATAKRPRLSSISPKTNWQHRPFTSPTPSAMAPITAWKRLIRYVSAQDGSVKYGEPIVSEDKPDIDALAQKGGLKVKVLAGESPLLAKPTGEEDEVKQLLGPLEPKDVPIVRCVGLNYRTHSKSARTHLALCSIRPPTRAEADLHDQSSKPASTSPPTQPSSSSPRTPSPTPAPPSPFQPWASPNATTKAN